MINEKHIWELGLRRLMRARASKQLQKVIRIFEIPTLMFDAADYIDLHRLAFITELPLAKNITDTDLEQLVHSGDSPVISFPRFPCHTHMVEVCQSNN